MATAGQESPHKGRHSWAGRLLHRLPQENGLAVAKSHPARQSSMPGRIPELLEATAVDKYALLTPAKPFPIGEGLDLSLFYAAAIGMSDGLDQTCPVETEVQKFLRQIDRLIVFEAVKDRVRECREFRRFTEQEDDTVAWGILFNRVRDHHQ